MTRLLTVLLALVALALYPALARAEARSSTGTAAPVTSAPRSMRSAAVGTDRPSPSTVHAEPAPTTRSPTTAASTSTVPTSAVPTTSVPTTSRPSSTTGPSRPTIAVVGDSILMQSWQQVHGALSAGGYTPAMIAKPWSGLADSRFFDWGPQLRALDDEARPDQLVVELGTNDLDHPDLYESGVTIDLVMETSHARRVVWVLPSADPARPDRQPNMERIRSALRDAASHGRHAERLDVIDFGRAVAAVPGAMEADLIHVTPYGSELLADLIRSGVDDGR